MFKSVEQSSEPGCGLKTLTLPLPLKNSKYEYICIVHIMGDDDWATQGARAPSATLLTYFS